MSNNIFSAITKTCNRELKRIVSRPIYLLASVGVMSFCFVFFLTLFNEGQPERMPVAVVDLDNSSLSRQFVRNLKTLQHVDVRMHLQSYKEAREEMQQGNIYAFVLINHDFASKTMSNRRPSITFYVNNSYFVAGSLITKDISHLSMVTSAGVQRQLLRAKGIEENRIPGIVQPIMTDSHLIGNPWANYGTYLLNVLFPGMIELMAVLLCVFCIGVELKERTSQEWLHTAGNSLFAALLGKLLPYTIIFTALGIIGNLLLYKFMHFPLNTSIGWMFLTTIMLILASQAFGIFFIGITPVLRDGVTFAGIFGTLGITFAGATFPVEQMPFFARIFGDIFPIRHYFNIYVNQALNGLEFKHSIAEFCTLLLLNILPIFIYTRLKNAAIRMNYPTK